jgi:hypothetical protein
MNETLQMYQRVAGAFAKRIDELFSSEATLEAEFKLRFSNLPFSRTDHWQAILYHVLRDCWMAFGPEVKAEPTGYGCQHFWGANAEKILRAARVKGYC